MDAHIEKLVAALDRHSAALEKFVGAAGKGAAGATGGASSGGSKPNAGKKGPTLDDITKNFTDFMSTTDKDERTRRKEIVLGIAGKFGADRATTIDPKHFQEALDLLKAYRDDNEDPLELFGEAGDEGEGSPI